MGIFDRTIPIDPMRKKMKCLVLWNKGSPKSDVTKTALVSSLTEEHEAKFFEEVMDLMMRMETTSKRDKLEGEIASRQAELAELEEEEDDSNSQ